LSRTHGLTPGFIAGEHLNKVNSALSLNRQADLLGISRSSIYYQPVLLSPRDLDLMVRIDKIHTDWPVYGARKIAKQLTRDTGETIGRKKARSLMEIMGIEAIYPKPHLSFNNKPHPIYPYLLTGLNINKPNQVWGADITYIKMRYGFLYLVAFMDWYSRFVVSWKLSTVLEGTFCREAAYAGLQTAYPEIVNTDQGVQFTEEEMLNIWITQNVKISMDHRGRCFDNIFTERLWRNVKYEEVYLNEYLTVMEAESRIGCYFSRYNYERLHESLDYLTPAEVYFKN